MPAPPCEIQIKRKATDDPVDFLRVHSEVNNLQSAYRYVFKRRRFSGGLGTATVAQSFTSPQLAISFTGTSKLKQATPNTGAERQGPSVQKPSRGAGQEVKNGQSSPPGAPKEPRQFRLSRDNTLSPPQSGARVRGPKTPIAVFIERKKVSRSLNEAPKAAVPRDLKKLDSQANAMPQSAITSSSGPLYKDPPAPLRNVTLPSGKTIPWNASPDTLAAEMEAYTLGEIGRNIAKSTSVPVVSTKAGRKGTSSFTPRAPLRRINGASIVNPASELTHENTSDEIMTDATEAQEEDSSYIIDTYVRMPAEMFESSERAQDIGLLILETQPDVDEFYNEYSDNDSENYDEDEDENAENHPSTDYPEDELEPDDEYDRNPYKYYNDPDEEYNDYDAISNDYDEEYSTNHWPRRPWMDRNAYEEEE